MLPSRAASGWTDYMTIGKREDGVTRRPEASTCSTTIATAFSTSSLLLLCPLGPLFKPSRRQAVASFPMKEARLLVAPQTAVHVAAKARGTMASQHLVEDAGNHHPHLGRSQR